MKRVLLILTLLIFSYQNYSQDIVLTFDGIIENTGANAPLDRVVIENLTRGGSLELTSSFVLNLTGALEIQDFELKNNESGFQKVYPNPFADSVNLEFYSQGIGTTTLNFYNLLGQQTARFSERLNKGVHELKFAPNIAGVYLISLNDNGKNYFNKVIASQNNNNQNVLSYIPSVSKPNKSKSSRKSKLNSFFVEGDALKYTAYSGSLIDVIYDAPMVSKTVTFEFTDAYYRFEPYFIESNFPSFVDIMFSVTDTNNKGVDYLDNSDFNVLENGSPVSPTETFRYVKKLDQVPYFQKTVIMLDNSSSVAVNLAQIKAAAISLVNKIVSDQEIAIYSFSDNAVLLQDFTTNVADLEAAINGITTGFPSTNLYGSLITGLDSFTNLYTLDRIEEGYLIALTDGDDTQGSSTLQQVIDARGKKRVFIAGLGNELDPNPLMQIAATGNYFPVTTAAELDANFNQIWLDILQYSNSFYWLNYMTPKRTGSHDLTVEALNNTNIHSDKNITGIFPADGFQSVFSGVAANIKAKNLYNVDWVSLRYDDTEKVLSASTYWATKIPEYTWSIDDSSIATLDVSPFDSSKAVITKIATGEPHIANITLTDVANNFTKEIKVLIYNGVYPTTIIYPATNITDTEAEFRGFLDIGIGTGKTVSQVGIVYGLNQNSTDGDFSLDMTGISESEFSYTQSNLIPNSIHYVRAWFLDSNNYTGYSNRESFTTNIGVPHVDLDAYPFISDITTNSYTGNGVVINDGGAPLTARGFVWSKSPEPTLQGNNFTVETGQLGNFTSNVTGLPYDSTIYVRPYATNSFGTAYGSETQVALVNQMYPDGITLNNQQQIDDFGKVGYTGVLGYCMIDDNGSSNPITDLSPLNSLTNIGTGSSANGPWSLFIFHSSLTNLNGLNNLTSVPKIWIYDNTQLNDLSALGNVSSLIELKIDRNLGITSLSSLSNLNLDNTNVFISQNDNLTSLVGLNISNNFSGAYISIANNPLITTLDGLNNLSNSPNTSLNISGNNLVNIDDLSALSSIKSIFIKQEPNLDNLNALSNIKILSDLRLDGLQKVTSLNDFSNLTSLSYLEIGSTGIADLNGLQNITSLNSLRLNFNQNLTSLNGLNNIATINDYIQIDNCSLLLNLDELNGVTFSSDFVLVINSNSSMLNINALSNLTNASSIRIATNTSLSNLDGLSNLNTLSGNLTIDLNSVLKDFCGIRPLLKDGVFSGVYSVTRNAFNPTQQNIIDGYCSIP